MIPVSVLCRPAGHKKYLLLFIGGFSLKQSKLFSMAFVIQKNGAFPKPLLQGGVTVVNII
jgi:hypothetical protein